MNCYKPAMTQTFRYDCPRCGYTCKCCGGKASHSTFLTETVICEDCRKIYDVVTSIRLPITPFLMSKLKCEGGRLELSEQVIAELEGTISLPSDMLPCNGRIVLHRTDTAPLPRGLGRRWFTVKKACPEMSLHRLKSWKSPCRCPRCNDWLERCLLPSKILD